MKVYGKYWVQLVTKETHDHQYQFRMLHPAGHKLSTQSFLGDLPPHLFCGGYQSLLRQGRAIFPPAELTFRQQSSPSESKFHSQCHPNIS